MIQGFSVPVDDVPGERYLGLFFFIFRVVIGLKSMSENNLSVCGSPGWLWKSEGYTASGLKVTDVQSFVFAIKPSGYCQKIWKIFW